MQRKSVMSPPGSALASANALGLSSSTLALASRCRDGRGEGNKCDGGTGGHEGGAGGHWPGDGGHEGGHGETSGPRAGTSTPGLGSPGMGCRLSHECTSCRASAFGNEAWTLRAPAPAPAPAPALGAPTCQGRQPSRSSARGAHGAIVLPRSVHAHFAAGDRASQTDPAPPLSNVGIETRLRGGAPRPRYGGSRLRRGTPQAPGVGPVARGAACSPHGTGSASNSTPRHGRFARGRSVARGAPPRARPCRGFAEQRTRHPARVVQII